jgi:hypothetical protein
MKVPSSDLFRRRAVDPTLNVIIEFRDEMRGFRTETLATLGRHPHRLNTIEGTIASLKADVGVLLGSVPVQNVRLDELEARVAALESPE